MAMVISWDKSENNPDPTRPIAEFVQAPAPPTAALADRPLGRRVAAAFIDLGLLTLVYVIISFIVGPTSPAFGPFTISLFSLTVTNPGGDVLSIGLYGAWAVLYLILLPCYYFTLETLTGQTVGKALLRLRVTRPDGARPAAGPIAMRTLLRLVDGLPAFYLAGFIVMLCTGRQQRQRLGDMAAGTVVDRTARSSRSLALAWTCVVAVVLATAGVSAARLAAPAGSQTYRGHGIAFSYPAGWVRGHGRSIAEHGNELWEVSVLPGPGSDVVTIDSVRLTSAVDRQKLSTAVGEVRHLIEATIERHGGAILSGPHRGTISGMPGVQFQIGTYLPGGTPVKRIMTFAFTGTTEYLINCQGTQAGAATIAPGCLQVLRTFRVTAPPAAEPSSAPSSTLPTPPLSAAQWRHGLRLLLDQMNRALDVSGVVTPDSLKAQVVGLQRCTPSLARLGQPPPALRSAHRMAARACARLARAATYYAAAALAYDPNKVTPRFKKQLHRGDAAVNAGSSLLADAVGASLPSG